VGEGWGATLFGFTLTSTCWELGVKLFYIQYILTSLLLARIYHLLSAARGRPSGSRGFLPVRKQTNRLNRRLSSEGRVGKGGGEEGPLIRAVRPRTKIPGSHMGRVEYGPITQRTAPSTCHLGDLDRP
jgi:hypothetical protein